MRQLFVLKYSSKLSEAGILQIQLSKQLNNTNANKHF